MLRRVHLGLGIAVLMLIALTATVGRARPSAADGYNDAFIRQEYGSTRAQDQGGNDAANGDSFVCHTSSIPNFAGDANRGNLMTLDAYNSDIDNSWYFAWVVDSSQALDGTSGSFFGNSAARTVNYILGIDTGNPGNDLGVGGDMNGAPNTNWPRFFSFNNSVDYFVALYPTGPDTMNAQVWGWTSGGVKTMFVDNFPVISRVVDFRRIVELHLDPTLPGMPAALIGNNQIRVVLVSTENTNDQDGDNDLGEWDGGRVIDSLGNGSHVNGCAMGYQGGSTISDLRIATQAVCHNRAYQNAVGEAHPYLLDNGNRQCLSNDALATVPAISSAASCGGSYEGIEITGDVAFNNTDYNNTPQSGKPGYVYLTEGQHAAPYRLLSGGTRSDFKGESSAFQYYTGNPYTLQFTTGTADLVNAFVRTDACHLYIHVDGVSAVGWSDSSLYVAIDRAAVTSGTNAGSMLGYDPGSDNPNAPDNKRVNFKNWDPDYVWNVDGWVNAQLFAYNSGWTSIKNFSATRPGRSDRGQDNVYVFNYSDCPNLGVDDIRWATNGAPNLNSNDFGTEVALPWTVIGGIPAVNEPIRIGLYTAWNAGGNAAYDVHDQAPGVGQGCFGYGCHERIGDEPHDKDSDDAAPNNNNDNTPFSGRNYGDNGDAPASDWSSDVDTIEEYFIFTPEVDLMQCNAPVRDFGDLPDTTTPSAAQTYPTQAVVDGPSHIIRSATGVNTPVYLGACVDGDVNGQPALAADGDNSAATNSTPTHTVGTCAAAGNDEDGIRFTTPLIPGNQACISVQTTVTSGPNPRLNAFIDWDGDGVLAPVTFISKNGGAITPTANLEVLNETATYCFNVPSAPGHSGTLYSRFRLSTAGNLPITGSAADGEVEDYRLQLACVGNYLWNDNGDNVQSAGDAPIPNQAVNLIWGGADGLISTTGNNITYSTTTDANGRYYFCGLLPDPNADSTADQYRIVVPNMPGTPVTPNVGGNPALDSDGVANGSNADGPIFTVSIPNSVSDTAPNDLSGPGAGASGYPDNQDDLTYDFGFVALAVGNRVWCEGNGNTTYDGSPDVGLNGVAVALYAAGATPGVTTPLQTTTTSGGGLYQFLVVAPGNYFVAVTNSTVSGGACVPPFGTLFGSIPGASADPRSADHDDDGTVNGAYTVSATFNVAVGGATTPDTGDPEGYTDANSYMMIDFGFTAQPNAIDLEAFTATVNADGSVTLRWTTGAEWNLAGYNIYRSSTPDQLGAPVNSQLIPSQGMQGQGASYSFTDVGVPAGMWSYTLEALDANGAGALHGPLTVEVGDPTAVALTQTTSAAGHSLVWLTAVLALTLGSAALFIRRSRV